MKCSRCVQWTCSGDPPGAADYHDQKTIQTLHRWWQITIFLYLFIPFCSFVIFHPIFDQFFQLNSKRYNFFTNPRFFMIHRTQTPIANFIVQRHFRNHKIHQFFCFVVLQISTFQKPLVVPVNKLRRTFPVDSRVFFWPNVSYVLPWKKSSWKIWKNVEITIQS